MFNGVEIRNCSNCRQSKTLSSMSNCLKAQRETTQGETKRTLCFLNGNFFHHRTNTTHNGGRMNQTQFVGHNCAMSCIHSCFLSFRLLKLVTQSHCTNTVLFRETLVMEIGHCLKILLRVENEGRNWFSYHVCRICKLVSMGDGHKRQYVRIAWLLGLI